MAVHRKWYEIHNNTMLNMFTFDEFSVCHSLGQSFTGIAFISIFWLIPQEYGSSQKFDKLYNNYSLLNMFTFDVFSICHSLGR